MTIQNLRRLIIDSIEKKHGPSEAGAIADLLLENQTGLSNTELRTKATNEVNRTTEDFVVLAISALNQDQPIQYILGEAWFLNRKYRVNGQVLIPRPETEELADWIIRDHKKQRDLALLDIGTGSGCLAISLQLGLTQSAVTGLDISAEALNVARQNKAVHEAENLTLVNLDFLDETIWPILDQFDIIVSNPPYIPQNERGSMAAHVADWEPSIALFVPDNDPLLFYKKIAAFGNRHLKENGNIYMECHKDYSMQVLSYFQKMGYSCIMKQDMQGADRMIKAFKPV